MLNSLRLICPAVTGVDCNGVVSWAVKPSVAELNAVNLLISAEGKAKEKGGVLELRATMTEEQWDAYVAARDSVAQGKRAARYVVETDPMLYRGLEDPKWLGSDAHNAWVAAKKKIREELPNWSDGGE